MYDNLICEYPLPNPPDFVRENHMFQTKSMDCSLSTYTITKEGQLKFSSGWDNEESNIEDFTGTIIFYDSNICGSGPALYTRNGEDAVSVDYSAKFVDGKLTNLEQISLEVEPAFKRRNFIRKVEKDEKEKYMARISESLLGKNVYVLWGSLDRDSKGYYANVVTETNDEICVKSDAKKLEILSRNLRDHIFWDSEEEALAARKKKQDKWDAEVKEFEEYKKEWTLRREIIQPQPFLQEGDGPELFRQN